MTSPINECLSCAKLRGELLDVAVAAGVYYEGDYTGKVRAPTPAVVEGIEALAKKAEEIDEAVIFMRTRGFVGSMLAMCKHVLRELDALEKAKNELIDERDELLRDMRVLVVARDEARKERNDFLDCCRAMLVAAGAPGDIDAMEKTVRSVGSKPSDYIRHVVSGLRDERDKLMRQIDKLIAASVKVTNTMPLSCGSGERELDHYDACGDLAQAFMAVVMERAAESDARCMAKYYSLGHKQEMECQMPIGHVGMHSMAWDGKTCQWTNGGA